jgi:two-component system phosphate regulon sensor histidine kinase PhoR
LARCWSAERSASSPSSLSTSACGTVCGKASTELLREARLVGAQWHPALDADSLANAAGLALSHRVTLVSPDGVVLGDSEFDEPALSRLENHAGRPEIAEAIRVGSGTSLRNSPSEGEEEIYAAVRTALGIARVSLPTRTQEHIVERLQRDVLVVAFGATLLALGLAALFARSVTQPVLELRDDAKAIAGGDLERRPSLNVSGEVGELATAFHQLAEQLSTRLRALEADERDRVRLAPAGCSHERARTQAPGRS